MKVPDPHTPSILIADDQADVLEALRFLIKAKVINRRPRLRPRPCWTPSNRAISTPS